MGTLGEALALVADVLAGYAVEGRGARALVALLVAD